MKNKVLLSILIGLAVLLSTAFVTQSVSIGAMYCNITSDGQGGWVGGCYPMYATCQAGFLEEKRCYHNRYLQQKYQSEHMLDGQCREKWITIEKCKWGCDELTLTCNPPPCTEGFIDNYYRCYGRYLQQRYQYENCRTVWKTIEKCSKCSDNQCV